MEMWHEYKEMVGRKVMDGIMVTMTGTALDIEQTTGIPKPKRTNRMDERWSG